VAWIRVESSVARNKKFVRAGAAPSWLWLCGLGYCQEGLTDGFIPAEALPYLGVKNAAQLAQHLVKAGLWDVVDGGWNVHDYLEHNKPASAVREIVAERRKAGANGGLASGHSRRSNDTKQVASTPNEANRQTPSKQPANPSVRTAVSTAVSTSTAEVRPLIPRRRMDAAYEHEGGIYVPNRLHQDWLALHRDVTEAEFFAFYEAVCIAWAGRNTGADMFRFWKARHDEKWPPERPWAVVDNGKSEPRASAWECRHVDPCGHQQMCRVKDAHPEKYPVRVPA